MIITMTVVIIVSLRRRPGDLGGFLAHLLKELERVCLGHCSLSFELAGAEGLEPSTCGFGDRRSTN